MIIGVVAAMIMPAFINNINNHLQEKRNATAIYKLSQITDKMKAAGDLDAIFRTTDEFVDVMAKHTKIAQRCNANNINNCFKAPKINNTFSSQTLNTKDLKTGAELGRRLWTSNNVGIVLNDGTEMILNYNTNDCEPIGIFHQAKYVGNQSSTAGCLAAVIDTNGPKSPNAIGKDIVLVNSYLENAAFQIGEGSLFVTPPNAAYSSVSYDFCLEHKDEYGAETCCPPDSCPDGDYWIGALKYCKDMGLEPLSESDATTLCEEISKDGAESEIMEFFLSTYGYNFGKGLVLAMAGNEEKPNIYMRNVYISQGQSSYSCHRQGYTFSRNKNAAVICKVK